MAIDEVLPIDNYEKKYFKKLSSEIECHISQYIENEEDRYQLKRLFFISLRQDINDFDAGTSTDKNRGIFSADLCAFRYRKISEQVSRMGGWANFEFYVNKTFVNEAEEFNKLANFVEGVANLDSNNDMLMQLTHEAKKLIEGLK